MFGRPADALKSLERAERLDSGRAVFAFQRGVALRDLGDLDGALAAFDALPQEQQRIFLRQGLPIHSFALVRNADPLRAPEEVQHVLAGV